MTGSWLPSPRSPMPCRARSPSSALLAAHNVVQPAQRVAVRIGLSAGEPVARGDDLFGATVQLASRLCDHAVAGSIVVSAVVQDLAIGKGYAFTTPETVSLKGFPEPVRISHVVWED